MLIAIEPTALTVRGGRKKDRDMSNECNPKTDPRQPMIYQIRVRGHLGSQWTDWFEGLCVTLTENGDTLLTGPVADQAALHGLLRKVRDLGMPLLSINCVEPGRTKTSDYKQKIIQTEGCNDDNR